MLLLDTRRGELVAAVRHLSARGLIPSSTGNASVRLRRGFLITPTRVAYRDLRRTDLVTVDATGRPRRGRRPPSQEAALHAALYGRRPDVGAVVHTHSPYATAWGCGGTGLPVDLEDAPYHGLKWVPVVVWAPSGTPRLAATVAATLASGVHAALLERHGVVTVGRTVAEAVGRAEAVEHLATVAWLRSARPAQLEFGSSEALLEVESASRAG